MTGLKETDAFKDRRKGNKDCDDVGGTEVAVEEGRAVSKPLFHCLTDSAPTAL